jgi:photosystem II stability/assembly factor-like uncharacterized protein
MARSFLFLPYPPSARARGRLLRSRKLPLGADKRLARLPVLLLGCLLTVLLSLAVGVATASAETTLNLQARDGSIVLQDLGKGNAAFLSLVTDGSKSRSLKYWRGKLPVKTTRYVAGDLNADQYTDVAALVKLPKGKVQVLVFTSTGTKLKQAASWKGKLDWASARLSVGFFIPDQTRDIAITSKGGGGGTQITLFRLDGKKVVCQPLALVTAGTVPANAAMTSGDVNGDFHDELVFFGPGTAAGTGRLVALVNNNGLWQAQKTWEGPATAKGAQLSCGDVDGDGIAEPMVLSADAGGTVMKFDCDGPEVQRSTIGATSIGISAASSRFQVTDLSGDDRADLVTLQKKGSTRVKLVVSVSVGATFSPKTYWSGKGAYATWSLNCTHTLPSVKRAGVHTLSAEATVAIVSVSEAQDVITFTGAPAEVTGLKQGDVLLVEPLEPLVPAGLMRHVESVTVAGGQTVVRTSGANLEDVFVQTEIDVQAPVKEPAHASGESGLKRAGRTGKQVVLSLELTVPFDDVSLIDDPLMKNKVTLDGEFKAGLMLDCWIKITVKWKYGFIPIPSLKAHVAVTFSEEVTMTITATGSIGHQFSEDIPIDFLNKKLKPIRFAIGPVPVWITPEVYLEVYGEIWAKAEAKITASEKAWATVGVEYNGGWKNLCDAGSDVPTPKITSERELTIKVGVMLKAAGLVYGVFGPFMGAGGYVRLLHSMANNPRLLVWAGIDADIGARLQLPKVKEGEPKPPWWLKLLEGDYGCGPFTLWEHVIYHSAIDPDKPVLSTIYTVCDQPAGDDPPWHNGPVQVEFDATSYGSKFKETRCNIDGTGWRSLTPWWASLLLGESKSHVAIVSEGRHEVLYYSIARGGEEEYTNRKVYVQIDTTPPTVNVTGADPVGHAEWRGAPVTVHVAGADKAGGSGILYTTLYVGGVPHRFAASGDYTVDEEGLTSLSWDAEDRARLTSALGQGEVKLDLLPPLTTVSGADDNWHSDPVTLSWSATDVHEGIEGSGVARTEFRVGRRGVFGAWTAGAGVTVSDAGDHTVEVRSVDNVGHVEDAQTLHVKVDTTNDTAAPTTTVSPDLTSWKKSDVTLTFTATDPEPGSGVDYTEYKVGAGAWTEGTSVLVSTEGTTSVQYRSTDLRGNVESPKTAVVKLDKTLPAVSASPATGAFDAPVTVTFTASDALSGIARVEYKVDDKSTTSDDGAAYTTGTSVLLPAPAGVKRTYVVSFRATDNAGNVRQPAGVTISTDTRKLVWNITGDDDLWHKSQVVLTFSATTPGGTPRPTRYLVDVLPTDPSAVWTTGSTVTIPAPANHSNDGIHTVYCRANDEFDNVDTTQCDVKIDTTPPVITWDPGAGVDISKWLSKPATLTFTATDTGSGVTSFGLRNTGGLEWLTSSLPLGTPPVLDMASGSHYVAGVAVGPRIWAATGELSKLWYSDDLGKTWNSMDLGLECTPADVECPTPSTVWVRTSALVQDWRGQLVRSTDGGGSWSLVDGPNKSIQLSTMTCQPGSADKAWAAGVFNGSYRQIYTTTNAGNSWSVWPSPDSGADITAVNDIACAPDGQSLWAVGAGGVIFNSTDGGVNWEQQTSVINDDLEHVACLNGQVAWVFSHEYGVEWTQDGGATWSMMACTWPAGKYAGLADLVPTSATTFVGLGTGLGAPIVTGDDADGDGTWDMSIATGDRIYGVSSNVHAGILIDADGRGFAWDGQLANMLVDRNDTQGAWEDHSYGGVATAELTQPMSREGSVSVDSRAVDAAGNSAIPPAPTPVVKIDTIPPLTFYWGFGSADNPGGSGLSDVSYRPMQTAWSDASNPVPGTLTSIEYADAHHGVAGWQESHDVGGAGVIVTDDGGSTWTTAPLDLGGATHFPLIDDVTCAWVDPTFYWASVATRNVPAGGTDYTATDFVTLTSWQASVQTLIDAWVLREADPAWALPGAEVRGISCPPGDPDDTWAVGENRFWYKAGHAAGGSWTQVPLDHVMWDVSAYKGSSGAQAWGVGDSTSVYALGTGSATLQWSTDQLEDTLQSVDSGVMADGELHVWAVGASSIVHSEDGGVTWSQTAVPDGHSFSEVSIGYHSVFALADNTTEWRKTLGDDGTWSDWVQGPEIAPDFQVRSIAAASDTAVTAVGEDGQVWQTTTASPIWQPVVDGVWPVAAPTVPYQYRATDLAGNAEETRTYTAP